MSVPFGPMAALSAVKIFQVLIFVLVQEVTYFFQTTSRVMVSSFTLTFTYVCSVNKIASGKQKVLSTGNTVMEEVYQCQKYNFKVTFAQKC